MGWSGDKELLEIFIRHGEDIPVQTSDGCTLLCLAVANMHTEVAEELLLSFVNPESYVSVINPDGNSPLHMVAANADTHMIRLLAASGADVALKNKNGTQAIHWAAACNADLGTIKILQEVGADINLKDRFGRTVLNLAAQQDKVATLKYLKDMGLDVRAKDRDGITPLHLAAHTGVEIVKWLKEAGADVNAVNMEGDRVIHWAAWWGQIGVVRYLLNNAGENVSVRGIALCCVEWSDRSGQSFEGMGCRYLRQV